MLIHFEIIFCFNFLYLAAVFHPLKGKVKNDNATHVVLLTYIQAASKFDESSI